MREVFVSVAAAEGNLGDVYIRREVLHVLDTSGCTPVVYSGSMGSSYIDALELGGDWICTNSSVRFLARMARAILRRRAVVVMAPGPAHLGGSVRRTVKHLGVALMLSAVRLTGSKVLVLGRSVRESSRINVGAERLIARAANIYVVRDHASCDIVGSRARFAPDFAFSRAVLHSSTLERRPFVGISLRHDRPVDIDALKTLVWEIDAEGHQAVLVTQVREDSSRHEMVAGELGLDHISWPAGRSHREHEKVLTDCYATLTAVVSDRLHVLILGARQGAIPIIVDCENEQKLHASLDPVLLPQAIHLISTSSNPRLNLSLAERTRIGSELNSASRLLEDLMAEVRAIIQ